jgi:large subunit ribosomal protein L4e
MKTTILTLNGEKKGEVELPSFFDEPIRKDLIKRSFEVWQCDQRQPYGSFWLAGKQSSASGKLSHQRRKWKTVCGYGISRIPRKIMSKRGSRFTWVGAFVSGTKGGREAHPPTSKKIWAKKINSKEKKKALHFALAATASPEIIKNRYDRMQNIDLKKINFPIVIEEKIMDIKKTCEMKKLLEKLLDGMINIAIPKKNMRAGRGKMRARPSKKQRGLLIVTEKSGLKSAENLGIEVANVKELNIGHLAPGGEAGRITIYTENAIRELSKK